jgi:outer membrane protein, heavy metal efflux system
MTLSSEIQKQFIGRLCLGILLLPLLVGEASAQSGYTWEQIKIKFEAANPALKADSNSVDELKAEEITAYLRPNPQFTLSTDGTQIAPYEGVWKPTTGTQVSPNFSYLHEREHKRELRLESAKEATRIGGSLHEDLERNLLYSLRSALCRRWRPRPFWNLRVPILNTATT